ncbi:hypothetical protein F5J12DRAFT_820761 [Pisolithus orientalis]|uniref:uncharacterized protein n=1 Tax=Pisolithus orientalis TaxID=936130 RepID=UPI00222452EC|nr:uncharacterized protein F5J12DRAFT_820761 [Pisolithus orientalis]KAI6012788.1 hypothetical protein F5J12DRAFT_820761 [Pisolithus orientalis]
MTDVEKRAILNKRLLTAARGSGDIEELFTDPMYRDPDDDEDYLFDINCRDMVSGGWVNYVDLILGAPLCDVDIQNNRGDTPLHLAVQIRDPEARKAIVTLLIKEAEAYESTRLKNKANQTPKDLCDIYCPNDKEVIRLASPPARKLSQMLDSSDCYNDDDDEPESE